MRTILKILTTLALTSSNGEAHAGCPYVESAFSHKMKEYRNYREANDGANAHLLRQQANCSAAGAGSSSSIALAAAAGSCEAQADASRLNAELEKIGTSCVDVFTQLNSQQQLLKEKFLKVQDDLESAMYVMENSRAIRDACPREVQLGMKMAKAFLKLEADILTVETRSLASKVDYGKFKDGASQLKLLTATNNSRCGNKGLAAEGVPPSRAVSSTHGAGSGAAPAGRSPRPASDLTGTAEAIQAAAISSGAVQLQPVP